jgi:prepilin-type N-terminal cleavage/methylation domain-containing protein
MHMPIHPRTRPHHGYGFTLVELLVVITIIVALAAMAMLGMPKIIERGRKVQALAQFKELAVGFAGFESENNRPLIPYEQRVAGQDTLYSVPGGKFSNGIVVAVLGGSGGKHAYRVVDFKVKDVNPREEIYMVFKYAENKSNGVGRDGVYYDPWGRPLMMAVNAFKSTNPNAVLVDANPTTPGKNDSQLDTLGLAVYSDTKPRNESYVIWTYGKDGKKGSEESKGKKLPPYRGSDDVVSWQ